VTTPIAQKVDVQQEVMLVRWECCRLDHSVASCPSKRLDEPMCSWAWAGAWVERLANGKNGYLRIHMETLEQIDMDARHSIHRHHPLFEDW